MDQWKISVLGAGGVGKTALAVQFTLNCFVETYDPTGPEDVYRKQLVLDNRMCYAEVIDDIAVQEEPAELRDFEWVREAQGFMLVYSITSRSTFIMVRAFRESVRRVKKGDPILILVGNKADKPHEREVLKAEGVVLVQQFGCEFVEVSAKTGQNVDRAFASVLRALRQQRPELGHASDPRGRPGERERKKRRCIIL
ncbi:P-loop containing nucleoside triphosphate hydrolase protein [Mycena capillaripes]|nr:P-loop containing nucleoside triphosphate hydrolase protein [Mycena capillaripes]